jgi:MarR family transcriptional regulator, negative regulator of the multidrug operon emrRAB
MIEPRTTNLLGALITGLHDHLSKRIEDEFSFAGETPAALVTIGYNEGRTVDFLSKALELSHSGTVRLVEKLEQSGLVRKGSGADKRTVTLHVTEQGRRKMQSITRTRRHCIDELLGVLSAKERKQFTGMVERMLQFMTHGEDSAEAICKLCEVDVCPQNRCPVTLAGLRHEKKTGVTATS